MNGTSKHQVKACFDDFVNLDLDGSFTLSADEFDTWHLQKMARQTALYVS